MFAWALWSGPGRRLRAGCSRPRLPATRPPTSDRPELAETACASSASSSSSARRGRSSCGNQVEPARAVGGLGDRLRRDRANPGAAQMTIDPTENQCDWTATPSSPVAGSRATIEYVPRRIPPRPQLRADRDVRAQRVQLPEELYGHLLYSTLAWSGRSSAPRSATRSREPRRRRGHRGPGQPRPAPSPGRSGSLAVARRRLQPAHACAHPHDGPGGHVALSGGTHHRPESHFESTARSLRACRSAPEGALSEESLSQPRAGRPAPRPLRACPPPCRPPARSPDDRRRCHPRAPRTPSRWSRPGSAW